MIQQENGMSHDPEIVTPGLIEKRKRMRKILEEDFKSDILYKVYMERNWLEKLFTDKILSMDIGVEYSSPEVADLCETTQYNINNKRKELVDYIQPIVNDTNRNWMHDYKSVFKIKMIDGLAGKDGVYTLKQLKAMINNTQSQGFKSASTNDELSEYLQPLLDTDPEKLKFAVELLSTPKFLEAASLLVNEDFLNQLKNIGSLHQALPSPDQIDKIKQELKQELSNEVSSIENKYKEYEESTATRIKISRICDELHQKLASTDLTVQQKEKILDEFEILKQENPNHLDIISLHYNAAIERLSFQRQEQKEIQIRTLKERAVKLTEIILDETKSDHERESASEELESIFSENKEISADLKLQVIQARKTKVLIDARMKANELKGWKKAVAKLLGIK